MKKSTTTLLTLMLVISAGQCAFAADLLAVYREALLQDAVYASAKAQYRAAQERLPQGRALLLPNVNFDAAANYYSLDGQESAVAIGKRDFHDHNYGVSVTQPLYRSQNALTYEQAKIQVRQAQTQLSAAAQDLMTRVAQNDVEVKNRALEQLVGKPVGELAEADLAEVNALLKDGAR